ncbi:glycerate kinase [uncultured Parabacteroides sp.]|uniref:glycerate kinase family protein n=1 Tax=uncultured Parabacteroides sp. TaxID=512312 RepID=UPI002611D043|nr:glycerate kinase [uncultured Parabacteroides sp.]
MRKIVIASDSFKGSVTSAAIAECAEVAVHKVFPDCEVVKIPVGDGGEGTAETLIAALGGEVVSCTVHDPLMRPVEAAYGILGDKRTAVIEMAVASGLTLVTMQERNPLLTTTYGTGELIKDALNRGCRNFLIGIGGSATNDGGTGMLQALGFRFLDEAGNELGSGGQILNRIYSVDRSMALPQLRESSFTIACDVNNPFYGEKGAAYVFARQKGADDAMICSLDEGLRNFAEVIERTERVEVNRIPGSGAAGGLGGGFVAFLKGVLKPGIQMVLEALRFDERIQGADLIITGEGKLDKQTCMGKTPFGVLQAAMRQDIPVIVMGGSVMEVDLLTASGFLAVLPLLPYPVSLEQAMDKEFTERNIMRALEQQLRVIRYYRK